MVLRRRTGGRGERCYPQPCPARTRPDIKAGQMLSYSVASVRADVIPHTDGLQTSPVHSRLSSHPPTGCRRTYIETVCVSDRMVFFSVCGTRAADKSSTRWQTSRLSRLRRPEKPSPALGPRLETDITPIHPIPFWLRFFQGRKSPGPATAPFPSLEMNEGALGLGYFRCPQRASPRSLSHPMVRGIPCFGLSLSAAARTAHAHTRVASWRRRRRPRRRRPP